MSETVYCSDCHVLRADSVVDGKPLCVDCSRPEDIHQITFKCKCGLVATVEYESHTCGDSLYYTCPDCGEYYKKAIRIPDEWIIKHEYKNKRPGNK